MTMISTENVSTKSTRSTINLSRSFYLSNARISKAPVYSRARRNAKSLASELQVFVFKENE